MTTRIVQETVASLLLHVSAPSNIVDPRIPFWKTAPNTGKAAQPTDSFIPITTRSITLAGGIHLSFTENEVPRPPSVSFARDIKNDLPLLNGMWDDRTEHWAGSSFLNIHGYPIPIIYWKAVYSAKQGNGWKPGEWKIIKSNYFDWKVSVLIPFLSCFVSLCVSVHRFWSHAGAKERRRISGQSSAKEGNYWDTRRYYVGWQQSERQQMKSCFSKQEANLDLPLTPHSRTWRMANVMWKRTRAMWPSSTSHWKV